MNTMEHHFEHTAMKSCEPVGGTLHPRVVFSSSIPGRMLDAAGTALWICC